MYLARRTRSLSFALAAGSVPLLLTLSLRGQPTPNSAKPLGSPRQVADALDKIVQPRFQDVTAGQFGMSRLVPAASGHEAVGSLGYFRTNTPVEAALLASADTSRRSYVMALLHCAHVPGDVHQKLPQALPVAALSDIRPRLATIAVSSVTEGYPIGYLDRTEPALRQAAIHSLSAALKGRDVQTQSGGWAVFLRPVRASKDSCLTCHTGAKRGDTLGVMVYAVSNAVNKSGNAH